MLCPAAATVRFLVPTCGKEVLSSKLAWDLTSTQTKRMLVDAQMSARKRKFNEKKKDKCELCFLGTAQNG